jgi:hypothetical protein
MDIYEQHDLKLKLYDAIQKRNFQKIKELLAKGADPLNGLHMLIHEHDEHSPHVHGPKEHIMIEMFLDAGIDSERLDPATFVSRLLAKKPDVDVVLLDMFFKRYPEVFKVMINPNKNFHEKAPHPRATRKYLWLIINGLISVNPDSITKLNNETLLSSRWGLQYPALTELEYVKIKLLQDLKNLIKYHYKYTITDILRHKNILKLIALYYGVERVPEILNELVSHERLSNNPNNIFKSNESFKSRRPLIAARVEAENTPPSSSEGGRRKTRRRRTKVRK